MNEYIKMAEDFLKEANAKVLIAYAGCAVNTEWKEKDLRRLYDVTIITPRGYMSVKFWDSIHNTFFNKPAPTSYDVLACLTKHNCGTFDEFCDEYGYDNDSIRALNIYKACSKEYNDLQRIFTEKQMQALREIS